MIWRDNITGDTIDVNLFNNYEKPLPYQNIADQNPQLVRDLISELKKNRKMNINSELSLS